MMSTLAVQFERAVARFHHRARLVAFTRTALLSSAFCGATAALWNALAAGSMAERVITLAASVAVAVIASAAWTIWRAPSRGATAALVDQRLGLQNHTVAALEVAADAGPFAALIVRDAVRRLHAVRPGDVLPFEAGRRGLALLGVAAVAMLPVSGGVERGSSASALNGAGNSAVAVERGAGTSSQHADAEPGAKTLSRSAAGRSLETASTSAATVPGEDQASRVLPVATAASAFTSPDAMPAEPRGIPAAATTPHDPSFPVTRSSEQTRGAGGSSRQGGAAAGASGEPAADAGDRGAGAAGAGLTPVRLAAAGAGGVGQGSLGDESTVGQLAGGGSNRPPVISASRARAAAQAAMTRDDIPPAQRNYVRDYFLRLTSKGDPR